MDTAISVKNKLMRQYAADGFAASNGSSSTPIQQSTPVIALQPRQSSLLTFDKGRLKTIKGIHTPARAHTSPLVTKLVDESSTIMKETVDSSFGPTSATLDGRQLTHVVTYNVEDGAALPDFEDVYVEQNVTPSAIPNPPTDQRSGSSVLYLALAKVLEACLPKFTSRSGKGNTAP
jgi:hypothetical protein